MTSAISKTEDNVAMSSQSRLRKFNYVGLIALALLMGSMTVSALAAVTATVLRSRFAAGTSGNTVQISLAGLTPGVGVTIAPPAGTDDEALTGIDSLKVSATNGDADVGTGGVVTATPSGTNTAMVVTYTGIAVPKKIGTYAFDVSTVASDPFIRTQLDGSGQISITSGATVVAGKTNQTVKLRYTATATDGSRNSPEDRWKVLNSSVLELWFPKRLPTPSSANLKATTGITGEPKIGSVTTIGTNPNYWIASIPITDFTTKQTLDLSYGPITVATAIGAQTVIAKVGAAGNTPTEIGDIVAGEGRVVINVSEAGSGSTAGTIAIKGERGKDLQAVSASSTGNEFVITFTAEGNITDGRLEIIPPAGFAAPQGTPATAGFTTVSPASALDGAPIFGKVKDDVNNATSVAIADGLDDDTGFQYVITDTTPADGIDDTTGFRNSIGIKIKLLAIGQSLTITYGDSGGSSGVTAPSLASDAYAFEVWATDDTKIDKTKTYAAGAATAHQFDTSSASLAVAVQAADGSSTGGIGIMIDTQGTADTADDVVDTDTATAGNQKQIGAGSSNPLTFTFTAPGAMDNGQFAVRVPYGFPAPDADGDDDGNVTTFDDENMYIKASAGSVLGPFTKVGTEVRVPITQLNYGATLTVSYKATAPTTVGKYGFTFKSKGSPTGRLAAITNDLATTDTADDLSYYEIEVMESADASGKAGVSGAVVHKADASDTDADPTAGSARTVYAGSDKNDFIIEYEAAGEITDGQIGLKVPDSWTELKDHLAVTVSGGASIGAATDADLTGDRQVVYKDLKVVAGSKVTFKYLNVAVQDTVDTDGLDFAVYVTDNKDETTVIDTPNKVTADLDGHYNVDSKAGGAYALPANIRVVAGRDGTGTVAVDVDGSAGTTLAAAHTIGSTSEAGDRSHILFTYKAAAQMEDGILRLEFPSDFTAVDLRTGGTEASDAVGGTYVTVGGGEISQITKHDTAPYAYWDAEYKTLEVGNLDLVKDGTVAVYYYKATTPASKGDYTFNTKVQAKETAQYGVSRSPVAMATSPKISIATVKAAAGKAWITSQIVADGDKSVKDNTLAREAIAGNSPTVTILFEATGTMDGGQLQFAVPSATSFSPPTSTSTADGYTWFSTPGGGTLGTVIYNASAKTALLEISSLAKEQTIQITYRPGVLKEANVGTTYDFAVRTRFNTVDFGTSNNVSGAQSNSLKWKIKSVGGTGTAAISPVQVFRKDTISTLTFRFTATATVGAISVTVPDPTTWTHPVEGTSDADGSSINIGVPGRVTLVEGASSFEIDNANTIGGKVVVKPKESQTLAAGSSISIRYESPVWRTTATDATTAQVGEATFIFRSSGRVGPLDSAANNLRSNPSVAVISTSDGIGKVVVASTGAAVTHNLDYTGLAAQKDTATTGNVV
ncbi:MAG: hypothetical protein QGI86_18135, partial [Candidatus Poribacteria bacterium]|nr:hypothetical protein [Candidatus Poribacteria bacterium]